MLCYTPRYLGFVNAVDPGHFRLSRIRATAGLMTLVGVPPLEAVSFFHELKTGRGFRIHDLHAQRLIDTRE